MEKTIKKAADRARRHARIRSTISGTPERPRFAVFKSNNNLYAQLIDDTAGKTIASASSLKMKGSRREKAAAIGKEISESAKKLGIERVVFDRGGFIYTGVIKDIAQSARDNGLTF